MQVNVIGFQINELLESSKKPLVVLGTNVDVDTGSLAAALVELLESYNKKTVLITKTSLPEAVKSLVKTEQQKDRVEPKSLIISLDWIDNQLDKVSYDLEGSKFNLIITSRGNNIDPKQISYSYRGEDYDLILAVGVGKLEELLGLGIENDIFIRTASINFDKNMFNSKFGKINIVSSGDSICATAALVFKEAQLTLPTRAAEALIYGMRAITNNFANVTDPQTFEAAAFCKRSMIPGMASTKKQVTKPETGDEENPEGWISPKIFRSGRIS